MKVVLAEKPSVARELASFLGAIERRDGYFEGKGYQVTWALGHLVTLKEPQDYDSTLKRWTLESLPIVPERFGLKPLDEKGSGKQLAVVRRLFKGADALIAATDAGREGELIFRYILELTGCVGKAAERLWLSSLTREAIRDAFARLRPLSDYDSLYAAARCRSEADWIVGLNATRYYTVRYRSSGLLWSVGRVQTPVLALIVRRDDEIRTFKPELFWELLTRYRAVVFKFSGDRFSKEADAQAGLRQVQGHPFSILGVDRKPERLQPPQLYDLTELQRDMNRRFSLSADTTLKTAQSLYESKLISYPRTDSRYLTNDLKSKIPGILDDLRPSKPLEIGKLDLAALPFTGRIINDAKVGDHHAIIPTGKQPGNLTPIALKVFDAILTRLIAAFYPLCLKEVTTVNGASNGLPFRARGVRVIEPGWTALYPRKADAQRDDEQDLPEFQIGETGPHEPIVRQGETAPPKPYTEATLLGAMETAGKLVDDEALKEALKQHGLGTPATRASIIETLLKRGYIARDKKTLAATDLGRYLIALVRDPALKSPELTGDWEAKLREIERGSLDPAHFMAEIATYTGGVIRSGNASQVDPDRLGDCPRCGQPVIAGKKGFGCSAWRDGCPFVLFREYKGLVLNDDQVRELLQYHVLQTPVRFEGVSPALLKLTDSGPLVDVPVPAERPRQPASKEAPRRPEKQARAGTRKRKPPGDTSDTPKTEHPANGFAAVSLGPCPLCKSEVVEQAKAYGCSAWRQGCKFTIWKTIAGKRISVRTAQALLKQGRSPKLKGFASKSGTTFDARLKVENGEVRFDFGP
ncbi:MAG: DNA topoisomerase 3 [Isosphaeraceae bacterium]